MLFSVRQHLKVICLKSKSQHYSLVMVMAFLCQTIKINLITFDTCFYTVGTR